MTVLPDIEIFRELVHRALATWGEIGSSDEQLLGSMFLVRQKRKQDENEIGPVEYRWATNQVLQAAIDELSVQEETEAAVLRGRFIEGEITRRVANKIGASTDQVNRWQHSGIENLARILLSQELILREERHQDLEAMLPPPPYEQLYGFDSIREKTVRQLLKPAAPWIVVIVGIGGIGKTSLADAVTRQVVQELAYEDVAWLHAGARGLDGEKPPPEQSFEQLLNTMDQELWPQAPRVSVAEQRQRLRRLFKGKSHLIVIDNLESDDETAYVVEHIREFTNPSEFLITSRSRPADSVPAYFVLLDELPFDDAAALIRQHAAATGLAELARGGDVDIKAIYDVAGGNPLALKLIVSLAAVLPFDQILADLAKNRPGPIEELYRYIYLESWRSLSENAQALLQAMPLVAEMGALPEQMIAISGLNEDFFWSTVSELVSRSLLEVRGTMHDRRYGIHRLTESFLRTEIIHWPEDE